MSFLDLNLNDVKELSTVPESEYELQIIDVELKQVDKQESKAFGQQFLQFRLEIIGEDSAKDIYHTVWLPKGGEDEKKKNAILSILKQWCDGFGISYGTGLNTEDFKGARGWCLIGIESSDQYGDKNIIKRPVVGR